MRIEMNESISALIGSYLLYPILYYSFSCFINRTESLYLRLNGEPRTKSSFTPKYERLDFRGITDAAGTTF